MPKENAIADQEVIAERFQPSRATLLVDRFMTQFIKVGGILVVTAVMGIFVFILCGVLPLFQGAKVKEQAAVQLPKGRYSVMGVDEWAQLPFFVSADGKISFADLSAEGRIKEVDLGIDAKVSAVGYRPGREELIFGTTDGRFSIAPINYSRTPDGVVTESLKPGPLLALGKAGVPITMIAFGNSEDSSLVAGVQEMDGKAEIRVVRLARKRSLFGGGELAVNKTFDLPQLPGGKPTSVLVNSSADSIVALTSDGTVTYFVEKGDDFQLLQTFQPFKDLKDPAVKGMDFLFGDVSLVLTSAGGTQRLFSLYRAAGSEVRKFGMTKEFEPLPGGQAFYASSLRNKAFLTGTESLASLRYGTSESIRWEEKVPFKIDLATIGGKYDHLLFLDDDSKLHLYSLNDPHPETSWKGLFGKEWYEGYTRPGYEWQSTGGSDEFEPKFSLVPLLVGTLKGTFFSLIFSVPIALFAAIYASQFLEPRFRTFVKPTMEIMASLPSVVLGFLAALWLAPLIENQVPAIILFVVLMPVVALMVGYVWGLLPSRQRRWVKPGHEFVLFLPIVVLIGLAAWQLGPAFEKLAFVTTDPATGQRVADFRLWWPHVTGASFEQRNSLVVGFMMGFAVIPIIFTISDDALSNVPETLRSGSLALGASRWQTAMRVVVPTASAGIFSALMIGLGRAVGETMIVVMATGNTPVMNFNIFSGMRTLSANIAVELPEAPADGTLYRVLFLGALLLFLLTFIVNTLAEVLRQHLREKFKTI